MRIILVDKINYPFGGTQKYIINLSKILKEEGHEVILFDSNTIYTKIDQNIFHQKKISLFQQLQSIYSLKTFLKTIKLISSFKPDVIHLHNINYLITPSIIHAAKIKKIPIVAHLHDYKLVCPKSTLIDSKNLLCYKCQNKKFINIFNPKCQSFRKLSLQKRLLYFTESTFNQSFLNIYKNINCFISPSTYLKNTFNKMGFNYPIKVIHNFANYKISNSKPTLKQNKIIYFGRLSEEKGLIPLCNVIKNSDFQLTIVGSGSQANIIKKYTKNSPNIKLFSFKKSQQLVNIIKKNDYVIVPSIWPENASMSIIESMSLGKPVITTNMGGNSELIENNFNGWIYEINNSSLKLLLNKIKNISQKKYLEISKNCTKTYLKKYSQKNHYNSIIDIYKNVTNNI